MIAIVILIALYVYLYSTNIIDFYTMNTVLENPESDAFTFNMECFYLDYSHIVNNPPFMSTCNNFF
jgi:hypothetical protein